MKNIRNWLKGGGALMAFLQERFSPVGRHRAAGVCPPYGALPDVYRHRG